MSEPDILESSLRPGVKYPWKPGSQSDLIFRYLLRNGRITHFEAEEFCGRCTVLRSRMNGSTPPGIIALAPALGFNVTTTYEGHGDKGATQQSNWIFSTTRGESGNLRDQGEGHERDDPAMPMPEEADRQEVRRGLQKDDNLLRDVLDKAFVSLRSYRPKPRGAMEKDPGGASELPACERDNREGSPNAPMCVRKYYTFRRELTCISDHAR